MWRSLAVMVALSHAASAGVPTEDEAEAAIAKLTDAVTTHDGHTQDFQAALDVLEGPFWYEGLTYWVPSDGDAKACTKKFGTHGTIAQAGLEPFLTCMASGTWLFAAEGSMRALDVKKLPKRLARHRARLTKLAKDHALVRAWYATAGPQNQTWTIYAAIKDADGNVKVTAVLSASAPYDGVPDD
jgi:hypothetical protein